MKKEFESLSGEDKKLFQEWVKGVENLSGEKKRLFQERLKGVENLSGEELKLFYESLRKNRGLSDREKRVIAERLGIDQSRGMSKSRKEVCEMFAISEDRLRELEEKVRDLLATP